MVGMPLMSFNVNTRSHTERNLDNPVSDQATLSCIRVYPKIEYARIVAYYWPAYT